MTGRPPAGLRFGRGRGAAIGLLGILSLLASGCLTGRPSLGPVPAAVHSLEGYASWRLVRGGASARSRFSFLFVLPDRGLIEINDPLNRTVSRLFVEGESADLVIPGKRAYWTASRREIMDRLLGFDLSVAELSGLLSGKDESLGGWALEKDDQSRVTGGRRGSLEFSVSRFFENGRLPQTIVLSNGEDRGSLRVLRLQFNQPARADAFRRSFLSDERYRAVTWAEVEEWLKNED